MNDWTLTCHDLANMCDVSHETVKRWAQRGHVPARKNQLGHWRFNTADWPAADPRRVQDNGATQ